MKTIFSFAASFATPFATGALALSLVGAWSHSLKSPERPSSQQDLPYVAIHNPEFIKASDVTFLQPEDRLIGVVVGNVAKAYPGGILSQHGLVEDQSPSGPIAVTW